MDVNIGERLKKVRLERGYTLKDVAGKSGYSKALISRIENGNVSPSINSLLKIASALEVKPHDLFLPAEDAEPTVVHRANRKKMKVDSGKMEVEFLTVQSAEKKIEPLLMTIESGASAGSELSGHNGEMWTMQLKGRVELTLGDKKHILEEGDCAYFKTSIPHSFRNTGRENAWRSAPLHHPVCKGDAARTHLTFSTNEGKLHARRCHFGRGDTGGTV